MPKPTIVPMTPRNTGAFSPIQLSPQRFLSLRDVLDRMTISRSLLYGLIKHPIRPFPSPVHIGRRSVWIESEVEAYMRDVVEAERS